MTYQDVIRCERPRWLREWGDESRHPWPSGEYNGCQWTCDRLIGVLRRRFPGRTFEMVEGVYWGYTRPVGARHVWITDDEGTIIDPTREQFDTGSHVIAQTKAFEYEESFRYAPDEEGWTR